MPNCYLYHNSNLPALLSASPNCRIQANLPVFWDTWRSCYIIATWNQAIIWTNADIFSSKPVRRDVNKAWTEYNRTYRKINGNVFLSYCVNYFLFCEFQTLYPTLLALRYPTAPSDHQLMKPRRLPGWLAGSLVMTTPIWDSKRSGSSTAESENLL